MASFDREGQKNLRQLSGAIFLKIRNELNRGIPDAAWKEIVTKLDGDFEMTTMDMARIESADDQGERLLCQLASQGMTVNQFLHYAGQARLHTILNLFDNVTIPVAITRHPFYEMNVCEGESVELSVDACGFPPPRFQWYKDGHGPVPNATLDKIFFASVKHSDAGRYFCVVSNNPAQEQAVSSSAANLIVLKAKPMEIREHPNSFTVSLGGNALMKCDVWGDGPIGFQWMKDEVDLEDGGHISGSQSNELRIYNVDSREWTGCYSCRIMRNAEVMYTKDATLQLCRNGPIRNYTATDKVALLIGAGDYRSDEPLRAPETDVQSLAKIFVSLNFKVVSLFNLTRLEMIAAIDEFKHLVGEDVYCVFYFCGHGFEASKHCFLVPPDAPQGYSHTHCLSADNILFNILLPRRPKVCCMILDICRKNREGPTKPRIVHRDIQSGSHIVCYGTSQGLAAYEGKNQGILVNHLKNILIQDMGIESVFQKLREEISQDPKLRQRNLDDGEKKFRQIPEVLTNLWEPERSFHDPIAYSGHTTAFMTRTDIWERAHEKPEDRDLKISFGNFNVEVRLNFQQEFSNVLKIYLSVIDPGPTFSCQVHISAIPKDVAGRVRYVKIRSGTKKNLCQNYLMLYEIQRLKSDMIIEVTVICQTDYGLKTKKATTVNLGLPLISRLKLWMERSIVTVPSELEDEECDEEEEN